MKIRIIILVLACLSLNDEAYSQVYGFNYDGQPRSYRVHLPPSYSNSNQYPVVINMHGYTSNASAQEAYSVMNTIADTANFIVVCPDGIGNAWNSGWSNPYHSGVDDVGFISALIDTLIQNYSVNSCKVYAIGMSNGGFMSHLLACELENKIAAIAGVTGMMADSVAYYCQTNRAVPILQIQGDADGVVNFNGSLFAYRSFDDMITWWYNHNGCTATLPTFYYPNISLTDNCTAELTIHNQCTGNASVYALKINNGGHTWPGGLIDIPSNGNTNRDIHGSKEIWNFLNQFDCNSGVVGIHEKNNDDEITLYPNPASNHIFLSKDVEQVKIYNSIGVLIREYRTVNSIDISEYKKGIYFFEIISLNDKIYRKAVFN